jgi:hypothetical protein
MLTGGEFWAEPGKLASRMDAKNTVRTKSVEGDIFSPPLRMAARNVVLGNFCCRDDIL